MVRSAINGPPSSRNVDLDQQGDPVVIATPTHPVSQAITRFAHERLLSKPAAARSRRSEPRGGEAIMTLSNDWPTPGTWATAPDGADSSPSPQAPADVPRRAARNADPFAGVKPACTRVCWRALVPSCTTLTDQHNSTAGHANPAGSTLQRDDIPMTAAARARGRRRDPRPRPARAVLRDAGVSDHGQRSRPDLRRTT